ncbi:hypothetical protein CEXT_617231 [Caerostris extrusa]|uniref:Uncharacterized protein n=1 Tax=Caerostris extrusa TaxID=172846 RepID=A0AAV4XTX0_CAEEX|nr:hypothetical protein CEXT_617231 [Caerostris extrusa]
MANGNFDIEKYRHIFKPIFYGKKSSILDLPPYETKKQSYYLKNSSQRIISFEYRTAIPFSHCFSEEYQIQRCCPSHHMMSFRIIRGHVNTVRDYV